MAFDLSPYQSQRRAIQSQYASQRAVNDYSRMIAQQRGNRQISDYRREWSQSVPKFTSSYAQRGLAGPGIRTGVYQKAMNQYVGDYTRGLGRMQTDFANDLNQYTMRTGQLAADREQALADVQAAKYRNMALAGMYLKNLKPLYGG